MPFLGKLLLSPYAPCSASEICQASPIFSKHGSGSFESFQDPNPHSFGLTNEAHCSSLIGKIHLEGESHLYTERWLTSTGTGMKQGETSIFVTCLLSMANDLCTHLLFSVHKSTCSGCMFCGVDR
ncbi:hypothetical protein LZ30DRAFT_767422 [Colletotrichum cereale]|nr:hypothetical protein LZ30DRAFT_767422 [Colletotrichum cereale]